MHHYWCIIRCQMLESLLNIGLIYGRHCFLFLQNFFQSKYLKSYFTYFLPVCFYFRLIYWCWHKKFWSTSFIDFYYVMFGPMPSPGVLSLMKWRFPKSTKAWWGFFAKLILESKRPETRFCRPMDLLIHRCYFWELIWTFSSHWHLAEFHRKTSFYFKILSIRQV